MNYLVQLTEENFNAEESKYESYKHFKQTLENINLNPKYFFKDEDNLINRYWYIESFITIPFIDISEGMLKFYNLGEMVKMRREHIKGIQKRKDYAALFTLVDKPFRIDYFLYNINNIPKEQFIGIFKIVWSSIESSYSLLSNKEVLDKLKESETVTVEALLEQGAEISDKDTITVYRGENTGSNHYLNGALSWTLDYTTARFFANRFRKPNPKIYKAKVHIKDILIFIDREKEVLIESTNLKEIEEIDI